MSMRSAAHTRLVWRVFGAASVVLVIVSLAATVPTGDRTTIVLTLWCDLVAIVVAAAVANALVTPAPEARYLTSASGGASGYGGFSGGGGGGSCGDGGGGGDC